jgi:hypothetical protein
MKLAVFAFFGMCFFGGCMLSKINHEKEHAKFDVEEVDICEEDVEFILSNDV